MNSKLVSIITPSYNSSKFIEETIVSVQNQTYTNWEILDIGIEYKGTWTANISYKINDLVKFKKKNKGDKEVVDLEDKVRKINYAMSHKAK